MKDQYGRLTVDVQGGGPLGRVVAEVLANGDIRARVQHPAVDLPLRADGKLPVGQAVGTDGFFRVLRQEADGQWYQSQVELRTGEIGDDFLHYLWQSEQVSSAVSLGVLVGTEGLVVGAGGLMIQALPGCPESLLDQVARDFERLTQISRRLADGETLESFVKMVLPEPIRWYPREPLQFRCWCDRERIADTLKTLPYADLTDLISDGGAEVTCHFCRRAYHFSQNELESYRGNAAT
ncbi:Hsp33 family molecular chaperone HslO [Sulfobacillus harzensis]|uniref:Hsp33 family molecular chaperone HslO n=1 Tax=Sulfobacillus harzensis TaxID=2729629 RepID=UPI0023AF39CB|nr:Hsp33 family molecular chaperone HslO [Sulfobacillus harzensis]